ncbi:MAG: hypothetical protein M3494_16620 [Actinomycetota bacterium]|jgi:hypothetical protein|nr:hypothetical protein [Rubrobacter sp.]MDQ3509608.1 hypothetical protein [Actinomycetota bacterium]
MTMDIRLIKEMRGEMLREVEANRLAKKMRARGRLRRESRFAVFAREARLDFIRLADALRVTGKVAKRKERP